MGSAAPIFRSAGVLLVCASAGLFHLKVEATDFLRVKAEATRSGSRGFRLQAEASRPRHLKISGTRFLSPDGSRFDWRGITAFRLAEIVARGRDAEADAYLKWAASKKLNVVRVLVMADGLFKLSPADGLRALPRLLDIAQRHGVYVEVVALADTAAIQIDIPAHVKAVAAICAAHANAVLEIANEPGHPTQARLLHDASYLVSLAKAVPAGVPVALGSVEYGDGYAAGTYATWHAPRTGRGGWPAQIAQGGALVRKFRKPVVNDEPIGAADKAVPGRRDNDPARFREAGAASRRAGLGATFHYEGGLQARRPTKIEEACLDAWLEGLSPPSGRQSPDVRRQVDDPRGFRLQAEDLQRP